ncbi:DUF302 domain-containing protein [Pontiellaceae bacterium B1224]|nr:DUF302 domain-containing protein [Pontiellaceae bacterium B1224]
MKYIVETAKSVEQAVADVEAACKANAFGVLYIHDLQQTMKNKGVDLANECKVLEICNPHKALAVLTADMSLNMALPCRISVYSENGQTKIGMIKPKAMLAAISDAPGLIKVAEEVEEATIAIIEQAK